MPWDCCSLLGTLGLVFKNLVVEREGVKGGTWKVHQSHRHVAVWKRHQLFLSTGQLTRVSLRKQVFLFACSLLQQLLQCKFLAVSTWYWLKTEGEGYSDVRTYCSYVISRIT
jgi:hypothetical protein